ncbi:MAG: efflux RND transporter permease subunit [Hyphomicrobiaceae bacterium]
MSTLETILSRPRTILTLMVVMFFAGIYTYITIPKEADPDIDVPVFIVTIALPGISPEDAERLLIKPMETRLRGLDGLKKVNAIAGQGSASLIVEFNIEVDHAEASADVREKVDQGQSELPDEAEEPVVTEINLSLAPVMVVALSGDVPERTLYNAARKLEDQIEAIPTVLEARLTGAREELLEVLLDPTRLESYKIDQADLVRRISNNNKLVAAGSIDDGTGRFSIKVPGLFEEPKDVYNLPVKTSELGVVTLSDVATIRPTFKDREKYSRFNGRPALTIEVIKRKGANIIANNIAVKQVVAELQKKIPGTVRIDFALDQSKFIHEVLGSLQSAIMTAIILVMIICVAALGPRSAMLVGLAIPTSFMIGFLTIGLVGMTVNMMLMFGMVLTVGILVDGAIVIVEYADRKMAEGLDRHDAYVMAAKRMFWPIVSSTATTLAAFLPLLLWPGVPGKFMSYLPITVIFVLSASLLTAMVFLPVIGMLLGGRGSSNDGGNAEQLAGGTSTSYDEIRGLTGIYVRTLRALIRYPVTVLAATALIVVAVFQLFSEHNNGVEFFVDTEPDQLFVFVSARGNLSVEQQGKLVRGVEAEVRKVDGIKSTYTTTGATGSGSPFSGVEDAPADEIGRLTLELKDFEERRPGKQIVAEIRRRVANFPGMKVEVRKREDGPPQGKDIDLEITSDDWALVHNATTRVRTFIDGMENVSDVEDSRPLPGIEWEVEVDRKEAGRYGADVVSVGAMIQLVTNGVLVGKYRPDNSEDEVDIRVRLPSGDRSINQLDALRLQTPNGAVPIANFVKREARPRVNAISRKDGRFIMTAKARVTGDVLPEKKRKELTDWLGKQEWPQDVAFNFGGADQDEKDSQAFLTKAMVGALFLMFLILVTQFNSFYQAIITLSTVVLSVVGVLIGMMVTGQKFSVIMTGTAIIALAGIVVNNSIVLIDTFNRLKTEGTSAIDGALRACGQRLRPVLLTTITTIFGLLPMALQINTNFINRTVHVGSVTSIWWVQLSTAIIFGLTFATLITLVLTPALLTLPETWRNWWRSRRKGKARKSDEDDATPIGPIPIAEAAE